MATNPSNDPKASEASASLSRSYRRFTGTAGSSPTRNIGRLACPLLRRPIGPSGPGGKERVFDGELHTEWGRWPRLGSPARAGLDLHRRVLLWKSGRFPRTRGVRPHFRASVPAEP